MSETALQIDSGMLQVTPKGAYYEESATQLEAISRMWETLFNYDRTLFCLTSLLSGTGYAKGSMSHMLLSRPQLVTERALIPRELSFDYETKVIMYNLRKERTPRALKNLLMLTGTEGKSRVNNARSRRIILEYIFDRDHDSLDSLAINYKSKLKKLIRHALGKQDLTKVLMGDTQTFDKWIGRYHVNAIPVVLYLFDKPFPTGTVLAHYQRIDQVMKLKVAAMNDDVESFEKYMKGLPVLTVMGYRNTYKVTIDKADVLEATKKTTKQSIQMQTAAKRAGTTIDVDYKKQDIYDLWKMLYHQVSINDLSDIDKVKAGIEHQINNVLPKIDLGEITVIMDMSKSMYGSDERPYHPMLTALSILSVLDNINDVIYVGGKQVGNAIVPSGATDLATGLTEAVKTGSKKIILISDGYENSVKGMFAHVYDHFKKSNPEIDIIHINPVLAADAAVGSTRSLAEDIKPLPVSSYKFLETEILFNKMLENRDMVKRLLVTKYQKLIGG